MARPPGNFRVVIGTEYNEVYGSDEEVDSEESRESSTSALSRPTVSSNDTTGDTSSGRASAQPLATRDGGGPSTWLSVASTAATPNHDGSSNVVGRATPFPRGIYHPHIPALEGILTLLSSNASMSFNEIESISSDEDNDEQRRTWHRLGEEQKMKRKHASAEDGNSAKRSCDAAGSSKAEQEKAAPENEEKELNVAVCSVCLDEINEGGEHRLVALKCGHPFGESCVKKWLENVKQCCPLCNRHAKVGDIRVVFLDCCRLGESYELSEARKEAADLRTANAEQSSELRELKLKLGILRAENKRLVDKLSTLEKGLLPSFHSLSAQGSRKSVFPNDQVFSKITGQCKYMAYGEHLNLVAVSMKPARGLFDGYGVGLSSLYDLNSRRTCKILHRQEIKDLCFHSSRQWLLTASLDNTAKISDVSNMSLTSVQNLQLDSKVWSCCWSQRHETNFFLGLANGNINEYDIRSPGEPVHVLRGQANSAPIKSVKSFQIRTLNDRVSGIISPQMRNSVCLYKEDPQEESGYTAQDIPVPGSCFSVFVEPENSSVLISTRAPNQGVMNEIWQLSLQGNEVVPNCRSQFRSGGSATIISKPIMCSTPSGESWACCLDDHGKSIQVFSCADGTLRHTLETKDPNREQMTQVEKIKLPISGRSLFALLGLSLNGFSIYY